MAGEPHDDLPPRGGIGLKSCHFGGMLESAARGDGPQWAEIHPQNYWMPGGPMHHWLAAIRREIPVSFHSVGLSLGDPDGLDSQELDRLAALAERYQPAMISDHLSWSSLAGERIPDLLPLPMNHDSLAHFVAQVSRAQDRLGRTILIENPSRLLAFVGDEWDEPAFLAELCRRSGCGLLLDINNVIVTAINLGFDPMIFLQRIDPALVGEIHVAGHSVEDHGATGPIAIDDHGSPVSEQCWSLLQLFLRRSGPKPVLVERDNNVPAFAELAAEVARADTMIVMDLADAA